METTEKKIWALLLCAGRSRRMQAFKPLLPLGDRTILEHTISRFQEAEVENILVVTGHRREELLPVLAKKQVQEVYNEEYATRDMFYSVCTGIRAICKQERPKGILVCPADIPLIHPFTIRQMIQIQKQQKEPVIQAVFGGKEGHPLFLGEEVLDELLNYTGDCGLQGFLNTREHICRIEMPDRCILFDTDVQEDYEKLKKRYIAWDVPDEQTCGAIWDYAATPENVRRHCRCVAEIAMKAAKRCLSQIPEEKRELFLMEVQSGALLHDVLRVVPRHGKAGAQLLRQMGYGKPADITEAHQNLNKGRLLEELKELDYSQHDRFWELLPTFLVYGADRLVENDHPCDYEEKSKKKRLRFQNDPEALQALERDRERFLTCREVLKEWMGYDLFE